MGSSERWFARDSSDEFRSVHKTDCHERSRAPRRSIRRLAARHRRARGDRAVLLIHQHIAPAYGVTLSRDQQAQSHVRAVEKILGDIVTRDGRPLSAARATGERQVGVCRHFTLLHVAMLRTQGIPARSRCGFGAYFEKGKYLDHWVTEYWNQGRKRWVLYDSQIDNRQRELFGIGFDTADVPRDQFVVAGDAWSLCRGGRTDPSASASSTCTDFGSLRATSSATSPR